MWMNGGALDGLFDLRLPDKGRPDRANHIVLIEPGERKTVAELDGPGCIRHIACVLRHPGLLTHANRKVIIRIYFDDDTVPSIEAPVGDFFGVMHGEPYYDLNCPLLSVKAWNGYNCYFPMPFARSARIEFDAALDQNQIYLQVDWTRYPHGGFDEPRRFCSRWRREFPTQRYAREYLLLDADGSGQLVGFVYGVRLLDNVDRWSHGGAENIYIDGDTRQPVYIRGAGGEDAFGVGFGGNLHPVDSHLFAGMPFYTHDDIGEARPAPRVVGYRFFLPDPITFEKSIHFRFGCMCNDICSTAYWYQVGQVRPFYKLPPLPFIQPNSRQFVADPAHPDCDLPLPDTGSWMVCGPFANVTGQAMASTLPAEDASFDPQAVYDAGHEDGSPWLTPLSRELGRHKARWSRFEALRHFVDFRHTCRPASRGVSPSHPGAAVARCKLHSLRDASATVTIAWDDELILRVNGAAHPMGNHRAFRAKTLEIPLRKGDNDISVKLSNTVGSNWGGWCFAFNAALADGTILSPRA